MKCCYIIIIARIFRIQLLVNCIIYIVLLNCIINCIYNLLYIKLKYISRDIAGNIDKIVLMITWCTFQICKFHIKVEPI